MSANHIPSPRPMRISRSGVKGTRNKRQHQNTATDEQKNPGEKNLKRQAEVVVEFHFEEEKASEIKNQVQTAKNSPEAQQYRTAAALKEVAEMQQKCSDSVKEVTENTRAVENTT